MNKFTFFYYWLVIASLTIAGFGLFIIIVAQTTLLEDFNKPVMAAFNLTCNNSISMKVLTWLYSVLGATMTGWGIFILFVLKNAFAVKNKWSWWAILVSMLFWFIPDTLVSAIYGVHFNVMVNCLILFFILFPLSFTYQDFFQTENKLHD
jgi:hypothetical protein